MIRLGVSACLLGEKVRYDGQHKRDDVIAKVFSRVFELVPFCPEVAIGLSVPRAPIQLYQGEQGVEARGVDDHNFDVTQALVEYGHEVSRHYAGLSAYIFKSRSPSCAVTGVRVHALGREPQCEASAGIYAQVLMSQLAPMPCEDESSLHSVEKRNNFLQRVFFYHQWQLLNRQALTVSAVCRYHERHRYALVGDKMVACHRLDELIETLNFGNLHHIAPIYIKTLMAHLKGES